MNPDSPPALPALKKRPPFEAGALWWLVFFDAAWGVEEIVMNIASIFLIPVCFVGTAAPVFLVQKKAGDRALVSAAKAGFLGVLAALPFPVTGTAFGAAMLAWSKLRTDK
jgi:hypothetical protein